MDVVNSGKSDVHVVEDVAVSAVEVAQIVFKRAAVDGANDLFVVAVVVDRDERCRVVLSAFVDAQNREKAIHELDRI